MKKLLVLILALILIGSVGPLALAQENVEPLGLDLGVSVLETKLTLRSDFNLAYFKLPFTDQFDHFLVGVKTPNLFFDAYGLAGIHMARDGTNLLANWKPADNNTINVGIGKAIQIEPFKIRIEGMARIDDNVEYGGNLALQYEF